ncbi:hypothetical protein HYDPIDRAFT_105903 [Hydnomerulius pinastri MD-312]|nr:hypothetical protein HYDPIDRAFT_105903 [Hydnomerulius pinastri MD-312]
MSSPPSTPLPARKDKGKGRAISTPEPEDKPVEDHEHTLPATLLEFLKMETEKEPVVIDPWPDRPINVVNTTPTNKADAHSCHSQSAYTRPTQNPFTLVPSTPVRDRIARVIPPNVFAPSEYTPRKRDRYAGLDALSRAIIEYMRHAQRSSGERDKYIPIAEIGRAVRASHACTEEQFIRTIEELLSEAYITSPLDDGFVVLTPRR